jgi:hypothetical protein
MAINTQEDITCYMAQHVENILWARHFRGIGNRARAAAHLNWAAECRRDVYWLKQMDSEL